MNWRIAIAVSLATFGAAALWIYATFDPVWTMSSEPYIRGRMLELIWGRVLPSCAMIGLAAGAFTAPRAR